MCGWHSSSNTTLFEGALTLHQVSLEYFREREREGGGGG